MPGYVCKAKLVAKRKSGILIRLELTRATRQSERYVELTELEFDKLKSEKFAVLEFKH